MSIVESGSVTGKLTINGRETFGLSAPPLVLEPNAGGVATTAIEALAKTHAELFDRLMETIDENEHLRRQVMQLETDVASCDAVVQTMLTANKKLGGR